jgi:antitoxin component YwqK of YwqJK toxin-antitoxin module
MFSQRSNCGSKRQIASSDESRGPAPKSKFATEVFPDPFPTDDADFDDHGIKKQVMPDISPVASNEYQSPVTPPQAVTPPIP